MKPVKKIDFIFLSIVLLYSIYAGLYIYRTSFMVGNERYFVLFDDAMISMRYAKNLAEGHGLVWNPGEDPVEGYTNPLWVVYMAIFHLLPIPASKISLSIQISGALFLIINLYFTKKVTSILTQNKIVPYLAVLLTAFYMPLNNWGLQGMEVSVLVLMTTAALWRVLKSLGEDIFSPWPYILLAIGTLVRIDIVVPYLVIFGYLLITKPKWIRANLLWGLGLLLVFVLAQTAFRLLYYGDLLPNTYYLKMEGFPLILRVKRGLMVLSDFIIQMNWVLFLLPFLILIFKFDQNTILLTLVILGQIAYSVYVGGDAWEHQGGSNRYLSIAMPVFFILFITSLHAVIKAIASYTRLRPLSDTTFVNLCTLIFALFSMYNFNFFLKTAPRTIETWLLKRQPIFVEANKEYLRMVQAIDLFTTPQAKLAVVSAGSIPYFSGRPSIDLLGKNDRFIAHQPNHLPASIADIRPGHMKWDYDYSIGQLKPDVIVQLWGDSAPAEVYLQEFYTVIEVDGLQFSVRTGSPEIIWELFEPVP
jgi:hypothetical protein